MRKTLLLTFFITVWLAACTGAQPQVADVTLPASSPTAAPTASPAPSATAPQPTAAATDTTAPPTETALPAASWLAYIGPGGNVWLMDVQGGQRRQVTQDAQPQSQSQNAQTSISYCCTKWSSDGQLLAYVRETGTPLADRVAFRRDVMVYSLADGGVHPVIEDLYVAGFAWRPATHQLSFALPVAQEYFLSRSDGPAAEYAQGIWQVDADSGESGELVPPSAGFSLVNPQWSPDGSKLSFDEVLYMEGRGLFAYYDFENEQYERLRTPLGLYSWGPQGEQIAYDNLTYIATGEERIWLRTLDGSEQPLSPDYDPGYAFWPVFSPDGEQLVYLMDEAEMGGEGDPQYTLFVIPAAGGEPRALGQFEQVMAMSWSPDSERLYLSSGPFDAQQVIEVTVADGAQDTLGPGTEPAARPVLP